jgi:hypothetical protein
MGDKSGSVCKPDVEYLDQHIGPNIREYVTYAS